MNTKQSKMFEHYYSLGPSRSMKLVADHFGVTERTVQRCASQFGWTALVVQREKGVSTAIKEAGDEGAIASALEYQRIVTGYVRAAEKAFLGKKLAIKSWADVERINKMYIDAAKLGDPSGSSEAANMISLVEALGGLVNIPAPEEEDEDTMH